MPNVLANSAERWAPISGFPNHEISDHGRVRSYVGYQGKSIRPVPKILKFSHNIVSGYPFINIRIPNQGGGKRVASFLLHRLVALAFVDGDRSLQVAHLDGTRNNNHFTNLMWATAKENASHKEKHGTVVRGDDHKTTKLCDKAVFAIRNLGEMGFSLSEIAYLFNLTPSYVSRILNKEIRQKILIKKHYLNQKQDNDGIKRQVL